MDKNLLRLFERLDDKTQKSIVNVWKRRALKEVRAFAKTVAQQSEFKGLPLSTRGLLKARLEDQTTLSVWGRKQNAGVLFGFNAPVNVRKPSAPYVINKAGRFITMRTRQEFASTLGGNLKPAELREDHQTIKPAGAYFGVMKNGKVQARALIKQKVWGGDSVRVFHNRTLPDLLFNEHKKEIDALVLACGEVAIQQALGL